MNVYSFYFKTHFMFETNSEQKIYYFLDTKHLEFFLSLLNRKSLFILNESYIQWQTSENWNSTSFDCEKTLWYLTVT